MEKESAVVLKNCTVKLKHYLRHENKANTKQGIIIIWGSFVHQRIWKSVRDERDNVNDDTHNSQGHVESQKSIPSMKIDIHN